MSGFWARTAKIASCCSVTKFCQNLQPHGQQHARLSCPSPCPGVGSNSCLLSWWCHPTISSSVTRFSSCPQSFPASGSFPMSGLFASGGPGIGASASVLPMNIQGLFPLGMTYLISLMSKGLWKIFSSTTVQKHQFFSTLLSLWSNPHFCTFTIFQKLSQLSQHKLLNVPTRY